MIDAALAITLLWAGFTGGHVLLSHGPVRRRLVGTLSYAPYADLYSLVALGTSIPLMVIYFANVGAGTQYWSTTPLTRILAIALVGLAFVILGQGIVAPPPSSMMTSQREPRAAGVLRVTRHPVSMPFALLGAAHWIVVGPQNAYTEMTGIGFYVIFRGFVFPTDRPNRVHCHHAWACKHEGGAMRVGDRDSDGGESTACASHQSVSEAVCQRHSGAH